MTGLADNNNNNLFPFVTPLVLRYNVSDSDCDAFNLTLTFYWFMRIKQMGVAMWGIEPVRMRSLDLHIIVCSVPVRPLSYDVIANVWVSDIYVHGSKCYFTV